MRIPPISNFQRNIKRGFLGIETKMKVLHEWKMMPENKTVKFFVNKLALMTFRRKENEGI